MKAIRNRLRRLEQRLGPTVESVETRERGARLEATRIRCGLPPVCSERLTELRDMNVEDILNSGRRRAALTRLGELGSIPRLID
jgi:hypothetical protein